MKRSNISILVCLAFLLLVGNVGAVSQTEDQTLVIGTTVPTSSNNLFVEYSSPFWAVYQWVYDGLYQFGAGEEAAPNLVKDYSVSEDGKVYTFKIKQGVKFHDGTELTAHDGEFSFDFINEKELDEQNMKVIEEATALDDYTLEIKLKERRSMSWLKNNSFLWTPFLPQHIWEGTTKEEAVKGILPPEKLIGSGPYKLVEFNSDESIKVEAVSEDASVDRVVLKTYGNASTMLADLKAGNIDMVDSVPVKTVSNLKTIEEVTILALPPIMLEDIIFNSWDKAYEEGRKTHPHPALQDVQVRKALAWAFDTEMAARIAHGKYGVPNPSNAFLTPAYGELRNTELDPIGFDLQKAKGILAHAGYKDSDGDGLRETKDGLPLEFDAWIPAQYKHEIDVAELWAQWAKRIGIKLNVSPMDGSTLWSKISPDGNFDIALWNWVGDPDVHFLLSVMTCAQAKENGWSDCGYCNPEYDKLFDVQARASSFEERKEAVWEMQRILYEDMPYIVWNFVKSVAAVRKDKVDFDPDAAGPSYGVLGKAFLMNVELI